jgi:hypothetical protein
MIEMPDSTIDLLFRMLSQNGGKLSDRAREREFALLTDDEAGRIEMSYARAFDPTNPDAAT